MRATPIGDVEHLLVLVDYGMWTDNHLLGLRGRTEWRNHLTSSMQRSTILVTSDQTGVERARTQRESPLAPALSSAVCPSAGRGLSVAPRPVAAREAFILRPGTSNLGGFGVRGRFSRYRAQRGEKPLHPAERLPGNAGRAWTILYSQMAASGRKREMLGHVPARNEQQMGVAFCC